MNTLTRTTKRSGEPLKSNFGVMTWDLGLNLRARVCIAKKYKMVKVRSLSGLQSLLNSKLSECYGIFLRDKFSSAWLHGFSLHQNEASWKILTSWGPLSQ